MTMLYDDGKRSVDPSKTDEFEITWNV